MTHIGALQRFGQGDVIANERGHPTTRFQIVWDEIIEHLEGVIEDAEELQPLDATLTALAGLDATAGLVEQTGADTFTKRALGVAAATSVLTRGDGDGRYQPLDSDLTAIAALSTTAYGRALLALADAAALRTAGGLVIGTNVQAYDADLDAVASSGLASGWTPYTPTVAAGAGSFTSVSATGRYKQVGKIVFVWIKVTITTNGTANSFWTVTAPVTSHNLGGLATDYHELVAAEAAVVGFAAKAGLQRNSTTIFVGKYDNTYLGGNGYVIILGGSYEAA